MRKVAVRLMPILVEHVRRPSDRFSRQPRVAAPRRVRPVV
jgi:hypothetical protein